jgi:hypothetical protein
LLIAKQRVLEMNKMQEESLASLRSPTVSARGSEKANLEKTESVKQP